MLDEEKEEKVQGLTAHTKLQCLISLGGNKFDYATNWPKLKEWLKANSNARLKWLVASFQAHHFPFRLGTPVRSRRRVDGQFLAACRRSSPSWPSGPQEA
jgi:hypothetical protein